MVKLSGFGLKSKLNWHNWSLRFQIIIGISFIQFLITLSLTIYQFQSQKKLLEQQSLDEAKGVVMSLTASTMSPILINDFAEIDDLIKAHSNNSNVEFVEIYDSTKRRIGLFSRISENQSSEQQKSGIDQNNYHDDKNEEFPKYLTLVSRAK